MTEIKLLLSILKEFGIEIAVISIVSYILWFTIKSHREERAEWRNEAREDRESNFLRYERLDNRGDARAVAVNKAINELIIEIKAGK